ncbi:hypothetical protein CBS9595_004038 [Malassezia furfur]|nr:hypothetical protein CBS9595_004038 [Malassezia furfur]
MQFRTALAVLVAASYASAGILRVIPGEVERRSMHKSNANHPRALSRRAPTNEVDEASITDPSQKCTAYSVSALEKSKSGYPTIWQIASIVQGDDEANSVWQDIQNSNIIPSDVQVKQEQGTEHMGVSSSGYDTSSDPDCWWTAKNCVQPKHQGLDMDLTSCPEPNTWGLTFDDGPNCTHNAFYDFLSQNNLKATMFYIGSNVMDWPYQAQRGIVDGHDICVHTWSHHYTTTLTNEQVFAELYYTAKAIKQVVGVTPTCWRPPYGDVDDRVRAIAYGLGLRTILWEEDTDDWNIIPAGTKSTQQIDQNYENIFNKAGSESPIVLTHEIVLQTMEEFQKMYPQLKKAYKNVVPLTACQNVTKPYPDSDISYPTFSDFVGGNVNASGLPDGSSISVQANVTFEPKNLNDTQIGYGHPMSAEAAQKSSSSSSSGKSSSGSSSSTGKSSSSDNKNGASVLSISSAALVGATLLSSLMLL